MLPPNLRLYGVAGKLSREPHASGSRLGIGLEKRPDRLSGVEIAADVSDHRTGRILHTIGPGMTAAFHTIKADRDMVVWIHPGKRGDPAAVETIAVGQFGAGNAGLAGVGLE